MIETCDSIWVDQWWLDWCDTWGVIADDIVTMWEAHLARLAREYNESCRAVQKAWKELVATPVRDQHGYEDFKQRVAGDYTTATKRARAARDALLTFASSGVMEVGS